MHIGGAAVHPHGQSRRRHVWMGLSIVYRPWALHEQEADPGPVGPVARSHGRSPEIVRYQTSWPLVL